MAVEGGCISMQTTQIQTQTTGKTVDPVSRVQNSGEEREDEPEEEGEEDSEFIDEDCDESGERRLRTGCTTGRVVTLQMLLAADILQPGEATMSIEYLGQRFMGDLLPDGKIKSVETDITFASPSAWAIHCKRIINPEKKSGCGWASVRYKGKKLEIYKTKYFKKRSLDQNKENEATDDEEMELKQEVKTAPVQVPSPNPIPRMVVKHNILGNRSSLHDANTLVESTPFSSMGKIQPFLVSLSTNAALVMDFHCHLTTSEVVGYLAGHWDVNAHNLAVTHAFPCRSRLSDRESAPLVEAEICKGLEQRRLTLVGWYHSHPYAPATPTLRDIDSQLEYQIRMKGSSDASYTPCIGIICSPYNKDSISLESVMISYWVMPPPENKPHEYGKPMLMSYSVVQDNYLSQDALTEMKKCADFYKVEQDYVNFSEKFKNGITYLEKLKSTLSSKFSRDQSNGGTLWNYLSELICPGSTGETQPPPTQNIPTPMPTPTTPLLLPTNLPITIPSTNKSTTLLGAELASALFASGKFPSPASLMSLSAIFPSGTPTSSSNAPISILKPLISTPSSHISVTHPLSHSLQSHQSSQFSSTHVSTQSLSFSHSPLSQSHSTQSHGTQSHFTLSHTPQLHVTPSNSLHSQSTQSLQSHTLSHTTPSHASLVSQSLSASLSSLSHSLSLSHSSQASHSSQTLSQSSHSSQTLPQPPLLSQSLEKLTQSLSQASHTTQTLSQPHTTQSLTQPSHTQQTTPLSLAVTTASLHTSQSHNPFSSPSTPVTTHPSPTPPPPPPPLPPPALPPPPLPPPPQVPSPAKISKLDESHANNIEVSTVTSSQN